MKLKLSFSVTLASLIFSQAISADGLNGIWSAMWTNADGYPVNEFVVVDQIQDQSFVCVLNPMGGYEYSPVKLQGLTLTAAFIDPKKNVYINDLGIYGRNYTDVQLNYLTESDTFEWQTRLDNSDRKYSYTRLSSSQKQEWDLFHSTCGKILPQSAKIKTNELKFEKLTYKENGSVVSILQTIKSGGEKRNYCVFNPNTKTVLSLPVNLLTDSSLAFSNLDILSDSDYARLFKSISFQEASRLVSPELLSICSTLSTNTRAEVMLPAADPFSLSTAELRQNTSESMEPKTQNLLEASASQASTYLVCEYRDARNGSNADWEWGEYPRWEWEKQSSSCYGLFASNCIHLNGDWARSSIGTGAIGTMFLMDATSQVEADFNRACNSTNRLSGEIKSREYAQYYVADSSLSFNHTVWFKKIREDLPYHLPFNRIIAFGDSLSDNGNLHVATGGVIVAGGYYQGRFSNGPVWVEYLSKTLGLDLYDWAVGAAASDLGSVFDLFKSLPYTIQNELANFTTSIQQLGMTKDDIAKTLFTVLFGGNNFVEDVKGTPEEVSEDFVRFVDSLIHLGAKYMMVINLPDISHAPKFNSDPIQAAAMRWKVQESNRLVMEKLKPYKAEHPQVIFYELDLFEALDAAILNPAQFHLSNTWQSCYTGNVIEKYDASKICNKPENYLFWDNLHPTTTFACQTANIAANAVFETDALPEIPSDYTNCRSSFMNGFISAQASS